MNVMLVLVFVPKQTLTHAQEAGIGAVQKKKKKL